MLKINQSSVFISSEKGLVEITNQNNSSKYKEIKQYVRSKYIPNSGCIISLLSNSKDGFIDGNCINIVKLDKIYLDGSLKSEVYDIELFLTSKTYRKNTKSISPNEKYFTVISEEGVLSIYDLASSIKYGSPIKAEIKYNNNNKLILFKKSEVYNKNILEFSEDSKHLLILSDSYVNILSITEDNTWNFRMQFDRTARSIGKNREINYLGCASFCFQDNILNLALERNTIQDKPITVNDLSGKTELKANSQDIHENKNNQEITSVIQLYTCQLKNKHKLTELIRAERINLLQQSQDILLSNQNDLLVARLTNKIHVFAKINNRWIESTQIDLSESYAGSMASCKFKFNHSVRMRFNYYQNKIIVKIGNDKVIVYSQIDNYNWEAYNIKKTNKTKVNFCDIDKIDINRAGDYIVFCDFQGHIALFRENNKEYHFVKDISTENNSFGINSLSFSKDGNKIIAVSNNSIKMFTSF
jgi:hypothetical protein